MKRKKTVAMIKVVDVGLAYRVEKYLCGGTLTERGQLLEVMADALHKMLKKVCTDEEFEPCARRMAKIVLNGRFDDEEVGED